MDSHQLTEINQSLQAIVRRAYDLGRAEALKRVVDVLSEDRAPAEQLALMAPEVADAPDRESAMHRRTGAPERPWWAWPVN